MADPPVLHDPVTGQKVFIQGLRGHDAVVRHRPRVPVLDVPGKDGDAVQHLGRKSRVVRVRRAVTTPATLPGIVLPPGIIIIPGQVVEATARATGTLTVPDNIEVNASASTANPGTLAAVDPLGLTPLVRSGGGTPTPEISVDGVGALVTPDASATATGTLEVT